MRTAAPAGPEPARSRFTGRAAILVLIALVLLISYASSLRAWLQQRDALDEARAQISTSTRTIDQLEKDRRRFDDPAYIEQQARERFGWVLPGEVGYRVIGADGKAIGDSPALADKPVGTAPKRQWYGRLWGSVQQAGKKPVAAKPTPTPAPDTVIKPDKSDLTGRR